MNSPTLRYFISETYGGVITDPTRAPVDPDVIMETEHSELEDALLHNDEAALQRLQGGTAEKFNCRGREIALSRHLVGIAQEWHARYADILAEKNIFNGVFCNYAPRDERFRNGPPFYKAELDSGLQVVTTFPADILKNVKDNVLRLSQIPNEDNPVFGDTAQFRSRDAHRWLRKNSEHTYPLLLLSEEQQADTMNREFFPDKTNGLPLEFVDIYGNMIFANCNQVRGRLQEVACSENRQVTVRVNNVSLPDVQATTSLTEGEDGAYLLYPNGSHIDLVRKWRSGETAEETTNRSVFRALRNPKTQQLPQELGSDLHITFPDGSTSDQMQQLSSLTV